MISAQPKLASKKSAGLFRTADGKNYAFVFALICSLFLLWGFAHALLDVLNKHFQNSLQVSKAQSGCVQAAVYGGYFLMAIPAGLVARRFGYKGGILVGLTLFALGAFWFVPATKSDSWNSVTSWVAGHFDLEVAPSAEVKTFLAEARTSVQEAGKAFPLMKKGEIRSQDQESASKEVALTALAKTSTALEAAAQLLPDSKKLALARITLTEAGSYLTAKEFPKKCSDVNLLLVEADKATQVTAFTAFLLGLFVIALGLTCLETIANPYTTVLGPPETGASRINLAQTCNALGWILGPLVGGLVIFSSGDKVNTSNAQLAIPYVGLGIVVTLILVLFAFSKIPDIHTEEHAAPGQGGKMSERGLWSQPHFVFAVVAQFFYVAAQTGINSFFINYVVEVNNWPERQAAMLLSFGGMGLFMAGRFSGSFLMRWMKPQIALATYALINVALIAAVMAGLGIVSALALIASYFFMSIMFPTIFALGIRGLGENTKKGSSFIVMSIVGGALAPMIMGRIADTAGMQTGFVIPLVCFAVIVVYGGLWGKLFTQRAE